MKWLLPFWMALLIALPVQAGPVESQLKAVVEHLSGTIGERNREHYSALKQAETFLERELERAGYEVERQEFETQGKPVANLIAELRGSERPEEIIVVGAHYDSARFTPGANDNGSGVAVLLILAGRLRQAHPARTVRFVLFVNEEPPYFRSSRMGSLVYARSCRDRGDQILGMISLETLGFYSDKKGSQRIPPGLEGDFPDTGNFLALVADQRSAKLAKEVEQACRSSSSLPVRSLVSSDEVTGVGWSDHWAFWQAGYPGIMATDTALFRYSYYHTPLDRAEQLDYRRLGQAVEGLEAAIKALAR